MHHFQIVVLEEPEPRQDSPFLNVVNLLLNSQKLDEVLSWKSFVFWVHALLNFFPRFEQNSCVDYLIFLGLDSAYSLICSFSFLLLGIMVLNIKKKIKLKPIPLNHLLNKINQLFIRQTLEVNVLSVQTINLQNLFTQELLVLFLLLGIIEN